MKNNRIVPPIAYFLAFLLIFVAVPSSSAEHFVKPFNATVTDGSRSSLISITLDAPLNSDFPPPTSVSAFDVSVWNRAEPFPKDKELLHVDLGILGGLFRRIKGNLGVTLLVRSSNAPFVDVQQLYRQQIEEWPKFYPRITLTKSDVVAIGGLNYSYLEGGRDELNTFLVHYSLPLRNGCYVEFAFNFVTKDFDKSPKFPARAHTFIDQIMRSVSIKTF